MSMNDSTPHPDQIWQVESAFPGEQTMIYRESATREMSASA
jgi:hypothetical protein